MASYTDVVPQFTPYIAQLPVEAMAKVGMQKQAQYDQGVQKIQNYIDNVAGLSVSRGVDSQYLDSKLNELGGKLKIVAGGDFSNQQLVNSVSGMAGQIIKDPNIQAAVYSTASIKKQEEIMNKARQKGELAVENEDLYNTERNKYLNSTELGAQFDGKYIPYTDVYKILKDVAADVGIDENIVQQLFETDGKGNPILRPVKQADGTFKDQPTINPVMAEQHLKGKSPEKIYQAFENALTPNARRQLAITGIYQNKSLTPEQLVPKAAVKYNQHIEQTKSEIEQIRMALYNEENGDNKDLTKIQDLAEAYQNGNKVLDKLISERDKNTNIDYVTRNADAVRADIYSTDYLQGIANQMKSVASWTEYKLSPWYTVQKDADDMAFRIEQRKTEIAQFNRVQGRLERNDVIDYKKWELDYFGKYGIMPDEAARQAAGFGAPGTIKKPITVEGNEHVIKGDFEDGFSENVVQANQLALSLTRKWFKQANPGLNDAEIDKKIADYAALSKRSIDPNSGELNAMTKGYADMMLAKWQSQKGGIPKNMVQSVAQYGQLSKMVADKGAYIKATEERAIQTAKEAGIDVESYQAAMKTVKPITLDVTNPMGGKERIVLSKEDALDYTNLYPEIFNTFKSLFTDKDQLATKAQAESRLKSKWGEQKFNAIKKELFTNQKYTTGNNNGYSGVHPEISKLGIMLHNSENAAVTKIVGAQYAKDGYLPVPVSHPILSGKENEATVRGKMATIIGKYPKANETEGYTQAGYNEVLSGKVTGSYVDIDMVSGVPKYRMTTVSDKGTATVTISAEDYASLGYKPYNNNETPTMFLKLNATGTTNKKPTGIPDKDRITAEWGVNQFSRTKRWDVAGDLVSEPTDPNSAWLTLYVKPKGSKKKAVPYLVPVAKLIDGTLNTDLMNTPLVVTDQFIDDLVQKNNK
jgi:hypothetical protein